jgi:opacity protein-like surface antigen
MDQGMGFGWNNQTVYKLGVNYGLNERWQLRAGYNYGKSPIPNDQLTFNTLAPATTEKHYSAGFTYKPNEMLEVTGTYLYAASHSQQAVNQNILGGVELNMHQNLFALSLGWVLDPGVTDYGDTASDPIDFGSGDHGFYAGFSMGQAKVANWDAADFDARLASTGKPLNGTVVDERSFGAKVYAGYQFNKYFALEGGFADFNDVKATVHYTTAPAPRGQSCFKAENDAWMLAAMGILPVTDKTSVFAKLGASNWSSKQQVTSVNLNAMPQLITNPGFPQGHSMTRGVDPYYGLGASYALLDNVALRAEWERFKFDAPYIDHVDLMTAGVSLKF